MKLTLLVGSILCTLPIASHVCSVHEPNKVSQSGNTRSRSRPPEQLKSKGLSQVSSPTAKGRSESNRETESRSPHFRESQNGGSKDASDHGNHPLSVEVPIARTRTAARIFSSDEVETGSFHLGRAEAELLSGEPASLPIIYQLPLERFLSENPKVTTDVIDRLKDSFESDAGVGIDPPDSVEALEDWMAAQPTAADRLRTLFGWGAYANLQREALEQKMREQLSKGP